MFYSILFMITDAIAGLLGGVLLLRFWMQAVKIRPPNSIGPFIYQLTDWLVKPLRRVLPGIGGYDWASLLAASLIVTLSMALHLWELPVFSIQMLLLASLLRLCEWIIYGFMFFLFLEFVFSWVNPHAPMAPYIQALNAPLLRPIRKVMPPIGGLDLSILIAMLLLQIGLMVAGKLVAALAQL